MELLKNYHHYKKEMIDPSDRVARCERYVVDLLLDSKLPDSQRESSIAFELKHHTGVTQFARILARKRGLPIDVCSVGALFHDIYVIVNGKYKDHAHLGAPIARKILEEIGGYTDDEISQIECIIYNHSDKHIWSDDPFQEIGKDADILDCFLIPNPLPEYLLTKPLPILYHYLNRTKNVWKELGIPEDPGFEILDNYSPSWFSLLMNSNRGTIEALLSILLELSQLGKTERIFPPALCITFEQDHFSFYTNHENWSGYVGKLEASHIGHIVKINDSFLASLKMPTPKDLIAEKPLHFLKKTNEKFMSELSMGQALKILDEVTEQKGAVILWSSIDGYELLHEKQKFTRLIEFGIKY